MWIFNSIKCEKGESIHSKSIHDYTSCKLCDNKQMKMHDISQAQLASTVKTSRQKVYLWYKKSLPVHRYTAVEKKAPLFVPYSSSFDDFSLTTPPTDNCICIKNCRCHTGDLATTQPWFHNKDGTLSQISLPNLSTNDRKFPMLSNFCA